MKTKYNLKSIHSKKPVMDFWGCPSRESFILAGVKATSWLVLSCWGLEQSPSWLWCIPFVFHFKFYFRLILAMEISLGSWYPRKIATRQCAKMFLICVSVHSRPWMLIPPESMIERSSKVSMNGTFMLNIYQNNIFFSDLKETLWRTNKMFTPRKNTL